MTATLVARILGGDRLSLARLLTQVENEDAIGLEALAELFRHAGRAHRVGVTGAPGTGKSTLVNQLALQIRQGVLDEEGKQLAPPRTVGIVAVDPSSPFTGGALLGDRIRMRDLAGDPGVFIRSMASRGALGGVARMTADLVEVLDAVGFEVILIETMGAGQAEVDIARTAQTTIVVDAPGMGDDVQAVKAGILEIADILVVNKADLPGAQSTVASLKAALGLSNWQPSARARGGSGEDKLVPSQAWSVPVLPTVATTGEGISELARSVSAHREYLGSSGVLAERERGRVIREMKELLKERLEERFLVRQPDERFEAAVQRVLSRQVSPRQAVHELLESEQR